MLQKERLALSDTFFGGHDRLRLAHRILDHSFLVKSIHHIPIESFPGATTVMERQKEQREHSLVDLISIVIHS